MATQQTADVSLRLEELEKRVRAVEDVEAIRNLKARYGAYCDDNYDADKIAELFVEDAVWQSGPLGRYEGREAIREFFRGASKIFTFAVHYYLNAQIEVRGDSAQAKWYSFMPCTVADGNKAIWRSGKARAMATSTSDPIPSSTAHTAKALPKSALPRCTDRRPTFAISETTM